MEPIVQNLHAVPPYGNGDLKLPTPNQIRRNTKLSSDTVWYHTVTRRAKGENREPHHASSDLGCVLMYGSGGFIVVRGEASWFTIWPNFAADPTESIDQCREEKSGLASWSPKAMGGVMVPST